jgi:putative flippase GtrA
MSRPDTLPANLLAALPKGKLGFLFVGGSAAGVHYLVALLLNGVMAVEPGWANPLAFACAFPVSYVGHRLLSFPDSRAPHGQALPRFAAIALSSFLGNQALMLGLVNGLGWPFWLALGVALVAVAVSTYLLGRYWAFK